MYDWAVVPLRRLQVAEEAHLGHYLLLRRSIEDPCEVAYYVVFAPRAEASLEQLVKIAGQRWQIEQGFELAKGECGLDHYGPEDLQRIRSKYASGKLGIVTSHSHCWLMLSW